jgi:hypothetical protein
MSSVFKFRKDEHGGTLGCDCCSVEVELAEFESNGRQRFYCSLCSTTLISLSDSYPSHYPYVTPRMLAESIHWLLRELKKEPSK